jgi:hypothetical protein
LPSAWAIGRLEANTMTVAGNIVLHVFIMASPLYDSDAVISGMNSRYREEVVQAVMHYIAVL